MSETPTPSDSLIPALGAAGYFAAEPVSIPVDRILRLQGYREPEKVRRPIRRAAKKAADIADDITAGEAGYRRIAIESCIESRLTLASGECFECGAFPHFLHESDSVLVFALTAGSALDSAIDELMAADDAVTALFLDSAGWLAVESITRQFVRRLRVDCEPSGLRITRRMGPGYTYRVGQEMLSWPLEEQTKLFAALGDDASPVEVLESGAMLPKMSRSGLYGLRPRSPAGEREQMDD
ncbi:hypothetical protein [Thioalkalivibrio sp. HK1]|uniref:hypothetical protein n=1 Tax=Thioalkalivibrio sp. HK1 TaxID=1469245 RepID=UPI000471EF86|nr:hypothetical protein [Thioalkalivibrio sp. HK1]